MEELKKLRQHLLTGVSFAIPFIACGGILIAAALAFAPRGDNNAPDPAGVPALFFMLKLGVASFKLMLAILAAYIAYSIAGKPGLVAGAIGGYLCNDLQLHAFFPDPSGAPDVPVGFLGAIVAGLLAGYVVQGIKKIPTHKLIRPIMPILIIPITSTLVVGAAMILLLGPPIADLNNWLGAQLVHLQAGSAIVLAVVLGAMIAFDMGGPVNKAAFFFAAGLITAPTPNYTVMGAVAAAICTPPLGMGLATLLSRKLWREEERESGLAALGMGMIGITEGAIPFAAADPLRVIPCIMLGSMAASTVAMLSGVGDHAPHGGPIVLFVVDNKIMYVVAIIIGTVVTALAVNAVKRFTRPRGEPAEA
ncbi:MAG: PTS fructose transporter subunit IIC [Phycisphaeraceae bacterium]|nr:MAG: PTS fructose transporter subunit IIC [Phycisphaeraceae bacterium]